MATKFCLQCQGQRNNPDGPKIKHFFKDLQEAWGERWFVLNVHPLYPKDQSKSVQCILLMLYSQPVNCVQLYLYFLEYCDNINALQLC